MNALEEPRRPGRPKREEETKTERRRRAGGYVSKLKIPDRIAAQYPDMEFRWVKDEGGRVEQLTVNDDWDAVPDVKPIHAGTGMNGKAVNLLLHMKPKKYMEEDRREQERRREEQLQSTLSRPESKHAIEQGQAIYSVSGNKLK